jgi:hypothetical protein
MDWIRVAQDRHQGRPIVDTVMNGEQLYQLSNC